MYQSDWSVTFKMKTAVGLVLLSLLLAVPCHQSESQITGKFSMETGSSCKYSVMDFKDDNKTGLHIKCSCAGGRGSRDKNIQYSCVYFGNPFNCPEYLSDGGPEAFYSELANYIKSMVN